MLLDKTTQNPTHPSPDETALEQAIWGIIEQTNPEVTDENSNKDPKLVSTQRDLIAGEVCKQMGLKLLPEAVVEAHLSGALHFHDLDYFIQPMFNCCLLDLESLLAEGTAINGKRIVSPKSFQVACTVTTQIIAQVASCQYGGQSINGIDRILAPYVRKSFNKYYQDALEDQKTIYGYSQLDEQAAEQIAWKRTRKEIKDGIQTIQYQLNTLMTTNGQAPFVTLLLYFKPDDPFAREAALIQEEILRQRIEGLPNAAGVMVTPAFPKLIYVLDEHNLNPDSPYGWLTELAIACTAKRMYPDYLSAKQMRALYEGQVFAPMGCRSFLSPWRDEQGKLKVEGRFNMGVVSLNLPQIALLASQAADQGDEEHGAPAISPDDQSPEGYAARQAKFWQLLEQRLGICYQALYARYEHLAQLTSDVSPLHWQEGALARLKPGESIRPYLENGYSTLSLGYIGFYETVRLLCGCSHTTPQGEAFALKLMQKLRDTVAGWKAQTQLGFALYGTPAESLTHRFCQIDTQRFGLVKDVTDKGYYTNSYHVDVREPMDVFSKFRFESQFQALSLGGMISYAEIPNMTQNLEALGTLVRSLYDTILYAEFNTKSDYCHCCGYDGEIQVNEQQKWECPQCHNQDRQKLTVIRRTCGYLGENFWNEGRTREIAARVLHL